MSSRLGSELVGYGNSHVRLGQVRLGMEIFDLKSPISGQVRLGIKKSMSKRQTPSQVRSVRE